MLSQRKRKLYHKTLGTNVMSAQCPSLKGNLLFFPKYDFQFNFRDSYYGDAVKEIDDGIGQILKWDF